MSIKHARVIKRSDAETLISVERACNSCQSCVHEKTQTITLSGSYNNTVELQMNFSDQWFALFHSLLLPLLIGLLFAFIADWVLSDEMYGIIFAFCGFTLGKYLCRPMDANTLKIV